MLGDYEHTHSFSDSLVLSDSFSHKLKLVEPKMATDINWKLNKNKGEDYVTTDSSAHTTHRSIYDEPWIYYHSHADYEPLHERSNTNDGYV